MKSIIYWVSSPSKMPAELIERKRMKTILIVEDIDLNVDLLTQTAIENPPDRQ